MSTMTLRKPEDARDYFGPLMEIALQTRVPFLLLTHLSKDGNALGRRIWTLRDWQGTWPASRGRPGGADRRTPTPAARPPVGGP